jgi:transposase
MKTKEQAFKLYQDGLSFNQIGKKLGVGKTTAHNYVKEVKLLKGITTSLPVPNGSEPGLNGRSERIPNERSEHNNKVPKEKIKEAN